MKKKIFITRKIPREAFFLLKEAFEVEGNPENKSLSAEGITSSLEDKHGLYCFLTDIIDGDMIKAAPGLEAIANFAVGYNNIDIEAAAQRQIIITNTPDVLTETTADLAWALILSVARKVVCGDLFVRRVRYVDWDPFGFLGVDVHGATLGVVGFGHIGQAVAVRALGFNMNILFSDTHSRPEMFDHREKIEAAVKAGLIKHASLKEMAKKADIITIHAPLTSETHHLVNREILCSMKRNAILVNTSRGPLIDEMALIEILKEERIFGAGLDVYEWEPEVPEELTLLKNVTILPHVGSATRKTRLGMALLAAKNLICALSGEDPPNRVV